MLNNVDQFQQFYGDTLTSIDLIENYRSTQIILDNAKQIVDPYTTYKPELHANVANGPDVSYVTYATQNDQAITAGACREAPSG